MMIFLLLLLRKKHFSSALLLVFSCGSSGKESACNVGDLGSMPGLGRSPGAGHSYPLQYSCLENPMDRRVLLGDSPWGRKESYMTEATHTHN